MPLQTADLFWQWRVSPGALIPIKRNGRYTMTNANGGDWLLIWDRDSLYAEGGQQMINNIWSKLNDSGI